MNCAAGGNSGTYQIDPVAYIQINNQSLTANPFVNSGISITSATTIEQIFTAFQLDVTGQNGSAAKTAALQCVAAGIVPYQDIGATQHPAAPTDDGSAFFCLA